jgi:HAD superfamily hydrolase (TIGR01509 family)
MTLQARALPQPAPRFSRVTFLPATSTGAVLSVRIFLLMAECSIAVFDLGGVLIDWNPGSSLKLVHPHKSPLIDAWVRRYDEMLAGPISGTVDILTKLNSHRVPLYALSNWSAETFPAALKRFEFLKWFRGVMLSGEVKLLKPDPRIFKLFLETFAIDPALTVYIDDREPNVEAAKAFGMHGILFTDAAALRSELIALGLFH